uniref:Nup35 n=1 Tax=Dictyostelium discoideum TaxID=44689 RepID=UPI003908BC62
NDLLSIPVNSIYEEKYDKRWLTVFGFSHDKTDLIVDELSKYGNIIEIEYPQQPNCNWIYLKFESEYSSIDLLKKNGLILGNCMIGIVPCKEKIRN